MGGSLITLSRGFSSIHNRREKCMNVRTMLARILAVDLLSMSEN